MFCQDVTLQVPYRTPAVADITLLLKAIARAITCDQPILADEILKAETPSEAKYLSRCFIKHGMWNSESSKLMTSICLAAATDNETYRTNILKTKDRYLAESINGNYFWSTGLSHKVTKQTNLNMFPGDNEMGKILMGVRETLRKQEDLAIVNENTFELEKQPIEEQDTFEQTAASPELSSQKPPLSEKPNYKRRATSTPPNARDEKKLANYKTPTFNLIEDNETVFDDSSISPTQSDPLRTSHLLSGNEDENKT